MSALFILPGTGVALPLAILANESTKARALFTLTQEIALHSDPVNEAGDIRVRNSFNVQPVIEFSYPSNGGVETVQIDVTNEPERILARAVSIHDIGLSQKNIGTLASLLEGVIASQTRLAALTGQPQRLNDEVEANFDEDDADDADTGADDEADEDVDDEDDVAVTMTGGATEAEDLQRRIDSKMEKITSFIDKTSDKKKYFMQPTEPKPKKPGPQRAQPAADYSLTEEGTMQIFNRPLTVERVLEVVSGKLNEKDGEVGEFRSKLNAYADEVLTAFVATLNKSASAA